MCLVSPALELLAFEDMPCIADGTKGRQSINAPLLAGIVRRWAPAVAYVELIGPRPDRCQGCGLRVRQMPRRDRGRARRLGRARGDAHRAELASRRRSPCRRDQGHGAGRGREAVAIKG